MSLVGLREVLRDSIKGKYAVGAFDATDHLFAKSILLAAEETRTPVILMVGDFPAPVDYDNFYPYLVDRISRTQVPVCLHFDHGASFEACALAVKRGCTSIMIDGSALPFEENVALTKKVVEMAHACNVEVEGEIGSVGRNESLEGENAVSLYTEPEDAVEFARLTGVDALAVSIGTVHGVYKKAPKMDFERLAKIRSMIEIPLVMHGGSGLSVEDFHAAVSNGMNKINAFTNLSIAVADKIVEVSKSLPPKTITGPIYEAAIETGKQQVIQHIRLFGTRSIDS